MKFTALACLQLLAATLTTALPTQEIKSAAPPYFVLAGDSTTATVNEGKTGGGWGDGFLATLNNGASGKNFGSNGKTTVTFKTGGYWKNALADVAAKKGSYDVYVTISFGHNDQKETSGITLQQYTDNLVALAKEVKAAGATPVFVTSLTRRSFSGSPKKVTQSLKDQRAQTIVAAKEASAMYVDLNLASEHYCNAIGEAACQVYNLVATDNTHLSVKGGQVFGRLVSDLLVAKYSQFVAYTKKDAALSGKLAAGQPA